MIGTRHSRESGNPVFGPAWSNAEKADEALMFWTLMSFVLLGLIVIGVARRDKVAETLRRFDAENIAKRHRTMAALRTPHAHMTLTIEEIDARTPPIETVWGENPDGPGLRKRFLWNDMVFDREEDATAARQEAVLREARAFYQDIDQQNRSRLQ